MQLATKNPKQFMIGRGNHEFLSQALQRNKTDSEDSAKSIFENALEYFSNERNWYANEQLYIADVQGLFYNTTGNMAAGTQKYADRGKRVLYSDSLDNIDLNYAFACMPFGFAIEDDSEIKGFVVHGMLPEQLIADLEEESERPSPNYQRILWHFVDRPNDDEYEPFTLPVFFLRDNEGTLRASVINVDIGDERFERIMKGLGELVGNDIRDIVFSCGNESKFSYVEYAVDRCTPNPLPVSLRGLEEADNKVIGALALPDDHPLRLAWKLEVCRESNMRVFHGEVLDILEMAGVKIALGSHVYESCSEVVQSSQVCGSSHAPVKIAGTEGSSAKMSNGHFVEFRANAGLTIPEIQMVKFTFAPLEEDADVYKDESVFQNLRQVSQDLEGIFSSAPVLNFCKGQALSVCEMAM
jgi:hypothetical protein